MPTQSDSLTTQDTDLARWAAEAEILKAELLSLAARGTSHYPLLDRSFGSTLRKISKFQVKKLPAGAFEFDPDSGVMTLNSTPLQMLEEHVRKDVLAAGAHGHELPNNLLEPLLKKAFRLFVLHEVRHIPQGLSEYSSVGALKKIAGAEFMAELDLIADRDAASAYAALEADAEDDSRASYLDHFQQALFFSGQYCFSVFRFTADRPVKMARAVGLTLMAARLARADLTLADETNAPLDGCIIVKITDDYSSIVVVLTDPETQIVSIMCEVPDNRLRKMAECIAKADFLGAIEIASALISAMKILA